LGQRRGIAAQGRRLPCGQRNLAVRLGKVITAADQMLSATTGLR